MKIILKILLIIFFIFIIFISYLSTFGIETDRFNNQISNRIKNINKEIDVELKRIKLVLNPLKLKLNISGPIIGCGPIPDSQPKLLPMVLQKGWSLEF